MEKQEHIPHWDGSPDTFNEFEDRCIWYERGLSEKDKPQAVAKIVSRLHGTAWQVIKDLTSEDQARLCASTIKELTTFLRDSILEVGIPEIGKRFGEYLGRFRRKEGQTMKIYIQNHRHLKIKLEDAIKATETKRIEKLKYREQLKQKVKEAKQAR